MPIPAGFHRMPLVSCLIYTTPGSSVWACCPVVSTHRLLQYLIQAGSLWMVMIVLLAVTRLYAAHLWHHYRWADQ